MSNEINRYEPNGRFCQAVQYNGMLFLSGLVFLEKDTLKEQTEGVLARIDELLAQYGSSRDRLLSANVYLKSASMTPEFNAIWCDWVVTGQEPVRTCVAAEMVHPEILVEIAVTAAVNP